MQRAWLARDLIHVSAETPVVTFEHIPMLSAMNEFDGYDDGPPAPTLITVNGKTSFRHIVSNGQEVLAVLRKHNHVLAIGAHSHVGERVTLFNEGVRTRFEQSPAVVGPSGAPPFVFPSGVVKYTVTGARIGEGVLREWFDAGEGESPTRTSRRTPSTQSFPSNERAFAHPLVADIEAADPLIEHGLTHRRTAYLHHSRNVAEVPIRSTHLEIARLC